VNIKMDVDMAVPVFKSEKLVENIHNGDSTAESEFVKRYRRNLYLMLVKRTNGDEFAANECTQEALLIALIKMRTGKIRKPEQISAFLRQTAIYVSVNYYRKRRRYVALKQENVISLRTHHNGAEDDINSKQLRLILRKVIDTLPMSRDREILNKFFLEEQEKKEVCECLNLSLDLFDKVVYRAKRRVREILHRNKSLEQFLHSEILEEIDNYE